MTIKMTDTAALVAIGAPPSNCTWALLRRQAICPAQAEQPRNPSKRPMAVVRFSRAPHTNITTETAL